MFSFLIVVLVIGIILEVMSLRRDPEKVEFDYSLSTNVIEPGAPFQVRSVITNKSIIPISYLAIQEIMPFMAKLPEGLSFSERKDGYHTENVCRLKGRQRKKLSMETMIEKRGVHTFIGDSIEFGDFLGFNEIEVEVANQHDIVVYPKCLSDANLIEALASFYGDISAKRYLIRDPILSAGSREYTGREPMKDINWMQSARRGELMVREYEYNRQLSVNVVLGVDGGDHNDDEWLDMCCSAVRTICEALINKDVPVKFHTNSVLRRVNTRGIWKCDVSSGYTGALLEGLGRVSSFACTTLEKLLEQAHRENDSDAAFIVVAPSTNFDSEAITEQLKRVTGREVLLVCM